MIKPVIIDDNKALAIVLRGAQESNYNLYEVVWDLNTQFSTAPLSEKYRAATAAIHELFVRGWIHFFKEHRDVDGNSQYEDFAPENIDTFLANPVTWYPYNKDVQIGIESTSAGEQAYRSVDGVV
jgi:hypothetical protein